MINKNIKYKVELCKNWEKGNCKYNDKCNFAHGEKDLIKLMCFNGIECYNEKCNYNHPDGWNAYDNKKECIFCSKGFCDKSNLKYKHIINEDYSKNDKSQNFEINKNKETEKVNIYDEKDFPQLLKFNNKVKEYMNTNNENYEEYTDILNIKKQLYNNYKYLSKLDKNSWSDDLEIQETNDKIKILNDKYNILKNKYKKECENVLNDNLNLEILELNDNQIKYDMDAYVPNIKIIINGIDLDGCNDMDNGNIYKTVINMEDYINVCINKIRYKLDNIIIKDNKQKDNILNYKLQLNKFMSELYLLKLNSEEIEKILN